MKSLDRSFTKTSVFHCQFLIFYIFSVCLTFGACYITGQFGVIRVKNDTFCLYVLFWHFLMFFIKEFVFLSLSFLFFDEVSNFRNNINQSKTGIGDKKLSVELYDTPCSIAIDLICFFSEIQIYS